MKPKEIREFTQPELERKRSEVGRELFDARLEAATGQLGHTHKVRALRRDLARLETISREREIAATASSSASGAGPTAAGAEPGSD